jgi:hypothetical protein
VTSRRSLSSIHLFRECVGQGAEVTRRRRTSEHGNSFRSAAMTSNGPPGWLHYGASANYELVGICSKLGSALGLLWRTVRRSTVGPASGDVAKALRQPLPTANDHRFNGAEMTSRWIRVGPFSALCLCVQFAHVWDAFRLSMKP